MQTFSAGCGSDPNYKDHIFKEGCLTHFEGLFVGNIGIVGGKLLPCAFNNLMLEIISVGGSVTFWCGFGSTDPCL
jgi:hypothetical protein